MLSSIFARHVTSTPYLQRILAATVRGMVQILAGGAADRLLTVWPPKDGIVLACGRVGEFRLATVPGEPRHNTDLKDVLPHTYSGIEKRVLIDLVR
jgi:hypothetical protein